MFYTAYTAPSPGRARPVTFLFNGGPGSGSSSASAHVSPPSVLTSPPERAEQPVGSARQLEPDADEPPAVPHDADVVETERLPGRIEPGDLDAAEAGRVTSARPIRRA